MKNRAILLLLSAHLLSVGCMFDDNTIAVVQPKQESFSSDNAEVITITVKNTSSEIFYYSSCGGIEVQKLNRRQHIIANESVDFPCRCVCAAEVLPGEELTIDYSKNAFPFLEESSSNISLRIIPWLYSESEIIDFDQIYSHSFIIESN